MTMITEKGQRLRWLLILLFVIYILLVPVWIIYCKSSPEIFYIRQWNGMVFASGDMYRNITEYANLNPLWIFWDDMLLNVAAFIPFGVYLELLSHDRPVWVKSLIIFLSSLAIEVMQFVLIMGRTDIVDLIANTLGGVIGIVIMKLLYREKIIKVVLVLAVLMTVVVGIFSGIATVKNYRDVSDFYRREETVDYGEMESDEEGVPYQG